MHLGPADSIWRIPGNDDFVKKLWADGLSASDISARIPGASRNSVIGRVHRLGLSGRNRTNFNPTVPRAPRPKPAPGPKKATLRPIAEYAKDTSLASRAIARKQRAEQEPEIVDLPADQSPDAVAFLERKHSQCCWPLGFPAADMLVCGARRDGEHSYCGRHHRLSMQASRPRTVELSDTERARRVLQARKNLAAHKERMANA